ncbi:MAG: glyoxalase/bleomycin resistance/dioxygenase family protein [Symploca sp. SIO2E9]|nr:glyoxalase/bleomycin resistance/dioxygenase family protein [Symploca sp. SIO2E9]
MSIKSSVCSLDAVILIAADFEEQVRFYRDVLGLESISKSSETAFFRCGEQKLAIFSRSHHIEGTKRLGQADHGISHLEFGVPHDKKDLIYKQLTEAGARAYGDNFEDADGNLFHFNFH